MTRLYPPPPAPLPTPPLLRPRKKVLELDSARNTAIPLPEMTHLFSCMSWDDAGERWRWYDTCVCLGCLDGGVVEPSSEPRFVLRMMIFAGFAITPQITPPPPDPPTSAPSPPGSSCLKHFRPEISRPLIPGVCWRTARVARRDPSSFHSFSPIDEQVEVTSCVGRVTSSLGGVPVPHFWDGKKI